jgi:hypothetical protein
MLEVRVADDRVHIGERFSASFQRTLRIPDDGGNYPLPPGLGPFPVHRVADYADRVPPAWREQGGVFIPMYQREALWLAFDAAFWKPNAVKIGVGGINAVSGLPWDESLHADPQDYLVCPDQPWLDGINAGEEFVRQFVAVPLGEGYTVEGQLTGSETVGGVQLLVFEPKPGIFPDEPPPEPEHAFVQESVMFADAKFDMGLAAGGRIEQKIYPDPHGIDTWDPDERGEVFVHIVNTEQYRELTGRAAPPSPIGARTYAERGLPWFALYDEEERDIAPSPALGGVKSVRAKDAERGVEGDDDTSVDIAPGSVVGLEKETSERRSEESSNP